MSNRSPSNDAATLGSPLIGDPDRRHMLQLALAGTLGGLLPSWPVAAGSFLADPELAPLMPASQQLSERLADALRNTLLASLNLIPVTGGCLSFIGALFIPIVGKSAEQMWREYVNRAISEALFKLIRSDLEGLSAVAELYRRAVDSGDLKALGVQSIAANTSFVAALPRFRLPGEEIALLPLYAVAATMHLALLRDMALNAEALGFAAAFRKGIETQLSRCIKQYSEYVDRQVAAALAKTRADNPNRGTPQTRNQPLAALLGVKAVLQSTVIDIRDTWYAFDAVKYPGKVTVRVDREIFYLAGWWDSNSKAPTDIPRYPVPTSTIRRMEFWQHRYRKQDYLAGVSLNYADRTRLRTGEIAGKLTTIDLPGNGYINRVRVFFGSTVERVELGVGRNTQWRTVGTRRTLTDPAIVAPASHRLSSMRSAGGSRGTDGQDDCGYLIGFQLVDQVAKRMDLELFDRIAPGIAPRLLDWAVAG